MNINDIPPNPAQQPAADAVMLQPPNILLGDILGNHLGTSIPGDNTLGQSAYDFTQRVFPSDLGEGTSYNGHYVVINIAVQQASLCSNITGRGKTYNLFNVLTARDWIGIEGASELSKTDALRYNIDAEYSVQSNGQTYTLGQGKGALLDNRPRYTRRIIESIALYMPNSEMTFTDAHGYDDISLTKFSSGMAAAALGGVGALAGGALGAVLTKNPLGAAAGAEIGSDLADGAAAVAGGVAQLGGIPINPKVEILFANTFQREFSFDFLLSPSTEEESIALQQIIRALRFHAAPERLPALVESFFWLPPSEFDLTFYNRGKENTNIPRINTCVLKQIDVSYAPTGVYATFSNGHPVQIRMVLRFTETSVVDKLKVLQGF